MKPTLTKTAPALFHTVDGKRIGGPHAGLRGDVSGLWGDVDACEITEAECKAGVNIAELVAP